MNLLDVAILIPIVYFCYRGFVNGIIKEVLSIIGIILGVFLTFQYMDAVAAAIKPWFEKGASFVPFLSAILIFISTLLLVHLAAFLSKKFLEVINLSVVNRIAGAGFGFLKSGIVMSALLLILAGFSIPSEEARQNSAAYSYIIYLAPWTYNTVASIYPGAEDFTTTLRKTLEQYNPIENFPFLEPQSNS